MIKMGKNAAEGKEWPLQIDMENGGLSDKQSEVIRYRIL
jgi:hypothetical protein